MPLSVPVAFQYPETAARLGRTPLRYFLSRVLKKYHSLSPNAAFAVCTKLFILSGIWLMMFSWWIWWILTRQFPWIEFVDVDFRDNGDGARLGGGLVSEIVHDQFLVSWVKPETWRKKIFWPRSSYHFFIFFGER